MTILVAGATGTVGSELVRHLAALPWLPGCALSPTSSSWTPPKCSPCKADTASPGRMYAGCTPPPSTTLTSPRCSWSSVRLLALICWWDWFLDARGYVVTRDEGTHTCVDGVFAAGDLIDRRHRQGVTAAASGRQAALDAQRWLARSHTATTNVTIRKDNAQK